MEIGIRASVMSEGTTEPLLLVYTGEGSSHSWLWLADSMENLGALRLCFGGPDALRVPEGRDAVAVSGGDVGRISRAIGDEGFASLLRYVAEGGTYLGLCAGAYLPLRSRHSPSHAFHVVEARLSNIASEDETASIPRRFTFPCGDRRVFQPARGPVRLRMAGHEIAAPMFGGPCWHASKDLETLAEYDALPDGAQLIADRALAERTVIGKVAVVSAGYERGRLILFGPHVEHPAYPEANRWFFGLLPRGKGKERLMSDPEVGPVVGAKRALSNARVAASGLRGSEWTIGSKVWQAEKAGLFIDSMWKRLPVMDRSGGGVPLTVVTGLEAAMGAMKALRAARDDDATKLADEMFHSLSDAAASFLNHYFAVLSERSGQATMR
jgi:hypothetical protein